MKGILQVNLLLLLLSAVAASSESNVAEIRRVQVKSTASRRIRFGHREVLPSRANGHSYDARQHYGIDQFARRSTYQLPSETRGGGRCLLEWGPKLRTRGGHEATDMGLQFLRFRHVKGERFGCC